jgi:PAS domain S-box-containing protein
MGALMRAFDWSATPLGPVEEWPQSLRTAVSIILASGFPMLVLWGREYIQLYNDAYRPILGATKHPAALGQRARECWPEIWDAVLGPMFGHVMDGGAPIWNEDLAFYLDRNGYLEETFFTFSYSAIRDESGRPGGILVTCVETTDRVLGQRRLRTLQELAAHAASWQSVEAACQSAAATLGRNPHDVPFALIYLLDGDGGRARLAGRVGFEAEDAAAPALIDTAGSVDDGVVWPVARVARDGAAHLVTGLADRIAARTRTPWPDPVDAAAAVPIAHGESAPLGVLVAGISARRAYDTRYRDFLQLMASQIATAISNARAYEAERERAEALAQIDRAKTAFFSNVSHEFRTPLTLMLGPTENLLRGDGGPLTPEQHEQLEILHRNGGRLLKLVNALLDFSRIEAGRMRASYRLTDMAALTRELASAFRSVIEDAGLRFDVRCDPIADPVYVDRDMWEKIVLNLLSNAFKFTLKGQISIDLRPEDDAVALAVRDTGTGIPDAELAHIFERFHRIEGAQARTHEGSGIGLALTHELVRLHGGTISVESRFGEGSAFTVRLPTGSAHLPPDRIDAAPTPASTAVGSRPFVDEAERWTSSPSSSSDDVGPADAAPAYAAAPSEGGEAERILVADDNADMREYLAHLLRPWKVDTASDGAAALALACATVPDLIVTDVMMPRLDGFELLHALRADDRTRAIPVLMLSARAGEDARVSGLAAGADDYVVKPFSARELTARVRSLLARARARREAELQKQHLQSLFMQAPTPIVLLRGPDHVVELANPLVCRLWGRQEAEVVGKPLLAALPELEGQPFKDLLDGVLRTGVPYIGKEAPARLDRGGGLVEMVYLNFVYAPLRNRAGDIDGILVIAFDVTDEVTARREIEHLRSAAEQANRTKDEFLAMLGHELRNPLAPILTALQLMNLRGDRGAEHERAVIDRQVRHMARLVDDLLDVSRIARGKVALRQEWVEIAVIVAAAIESASPLLEERQHEIELHVPRSGLTVNGDVTRLTQSVMNVLTNAAKYTEPRGRITVRARRAGAEVEVTIADNGIGIEPYMLPKVFDMFAQAPQAMDRTHGGLGLGLTIVRSLVELHGGSVEARSDGLGKGSEFVIRLPAIQIEEAEPAGQPPIEARAPLTARTGRRVLVVDDNVDAARLIAAALEAIGYETRVAFDGPTALDAAAAFEPHAALLDVGLPLMDGYELARQLRDRTRNARPPSLIAVTGYGQPSDYERSRAAGFQAHVVKPVDVHELARLLEQLILA